MRVIPQRYLRGWQECEPHRAQMWAAMLGDKLVGRWLSKSYAEQALASAILRAKGPKRNYRLGARMGKKELMK